jgi:hypothetical protein
MSSGEAFSIASAFGWITPEGLLLWALSPFFPPFSERHRSPEHAVVLNDFLDWLSWQGRLWTSMEEPGVPPPLDSPFLSCKAG